MLPSGTGLRSPWELGLPALTGHGHAVPSPVWWVLAIGHQPCTCHPGCFSTSWSLRKGKTHAPPSSAPEVAGPPQPVMQPAQPSQLSDLDQASL